MPKPTKFGAVKATGIAVGFNKGHVVTHRQLRQKPSNRKGVSTQHTHDIIMQTRSSPTRTVRVDIHYSDDMSDSTAAT